MDSKYFWERKVSFGNSIEMRKESMPWSVKFFKTKVYFSNKESEFRQTIKKVKNNRTLKNFFRKSKNLIKVFWKNFRENADNWNYRANADGGFLIDD